MQHKRHEGIKNLLAVAGFVGVQDLADRFNVTTETIRRDLEQMEIEGVAKRVRGGAVSTSKRAPSDTGIIYESAYIHRKEDFAAEKQAIASVAADMINDGDTVIITPGTTTQAVASLIHGKKDVTVITNSLPIAMELSDREGVSVFCLGGFARSENYSVVGDDVSDRISMFNANKLIMGIGGISAEAGLTDYRMDESSVIRAFINKAEYAIGVTDHSKIGKILRVNICPAARLDCLITDPGIEADQKQALERQGIEVKIAQP